MTLNRDLPIGTRVMLSPNSPYVINGCPLLNPVDTWGTVAAHNTGGSEQIISIHVRWDTRADLVWYSGNDLDFILESRSAKFDSRAEAREKAKEFDMVVVDFGKDSNPRWGLGVKEI